MENNNKNKLLKEIKNYSNTAKAFKWIGYGLFVAAILAGVPVMFLGGVVTGLITMFGCLLFGYGFYNSSILCETKVNALKLRSEMQSEPTVDEYDSNKTHVETQDYSDVATKDHNINIDYDVKNSTDVSKSEPRNTTDSKNSTDDLER